MKVKAISPGTYIVGFRLDKGQGEFKAMEVRSDMGAGAIIDINMDEDQFKALGEETTMPMNNDTTLVNILYNMAQLIAAMQEQGAQ